MWSGGPRASQKAEGADKMHSGRVRQAAVQRNAELWPAAARRRRDFGHCKRIAAGPIMASLYVDYAVAATQQCQRKRINRGLNHFTRLQRKPNKPLHNLD